MKRIILFTVLLTQVNAQVNQALPDAPSHGDNQVENRLFWGAVLVTAAGMSADGYTTSLIRPNFLKLKGVQTAPCTMEGGEPLIFGREPTIHRIMLGSVMQFSVMAGSSYLLHRSHNKIIHSLAYAPLALQNAWSWRGFAEGLSQC